MKKRYYILALLLGLGFSLNAFALDMPLVDSIPSSVDSYYYTLTIYVEEGSTVTVVGGPSDTAPVTDGAGTDSEDGMVEVTVGLTQNALNTFSITAQKGDQISAASVVEINEVSIAPTGDGDSTPPSTPVLNDIPDLVDSTEYIITGQAEANANIYAYTPLGIVVGSTAADEDGFFQVTVKLEENKTNRFNVTAEDEAGNESMATQAVIRQSVDLPDAEEEEEPELYLSSQIFFNDVEGHWAESYINQLYEENVVSGKSEGVFDPNGLITRAELTKIALLAFGYSVNTNVDVHPFQDVPRNSWFAPYVEEAKRLDIVEGYPSGGFGPNDFITRAAALKIILEAAGVELTAALPDFPDVPIDAWFADYVGYAAANGIVGGYPDGTFGPGKNITRAEVAKIVVKVLELQ